MKNIQTKLKQGGNLRLHKLTSNSQQVLGQFNEEDVKSNLKSDEMKLDKCELERSLGLYWNIGNDTFTFGVSKNDKPITKRTNFCH